MNRIACCIIILYSLQTLSQKLPEIAPAPPDVAAMQKYGDVPVSFYTGIPNIGVPIYTIPTKAGLQIPIELKYHASGIKVDEKTGRIGLGWSLHTGGVISFNTLGIPDGEGTPEKPLGSDIPNLSFDYFNYNEDYYNYALSASAGQQEASRIGQADTAPDMFQYSFLGRSGKFIFDPLGPIHLIPYEGITIQANETRRASNSILSFTITDEKGNQFFFNDMSISETTRKYEAPYPKPPTISRNWSLSKIKTYLGEEFFFSYKNVNYTYTIAEEESDYHKFSAGTSSGCPNISKKTNELYSNQTESVLDKITYPEGSIQFTYSDNIVYPIVGSNTRLDSPGNPALRKIEIKNNYAPIKDFVLDYDYFNAHGSSSVTEDNYRLKLISVTENSEKVHQFVYNEAENLPPRFSKSQDYWGYYNGVFNTSLLPDVAYGTKLIQGAKRHINPQKVKANILEKIIYPTGGYSRFAYESNTYFGTKDTLISKSITFPRASSSLYEENHPFTLESNTTGVVLNFVNECQPNNSNDPGLPSEGDICSIKILNNNNQVVWSETNNAGTYDLNFLGDGEYTFRYEASGNCLCQASISYFVKQTSPQSNIKAGGLRIKNITNYDGNKEETTYYEYTKPNTQTSSGAIQGVPVFSYIQRNPQTSSGSQGCQYLVRSYSSLFPLSTVGQSVGYASVTVYKNDTQSGKTVYEYTNTGDYSFSQNPSLHFSLIPPDYSSWKKGLLLHQKTYDNTNTIIHLESNTYEFDNQFTTNATDRIGTYGVGTGFLILQSKTEWSCGYICVSYAEFDWKYYIIPSAWIKLTEKLVEQTLKNNSRIASTTKYFYDNPIHLQLTQTETLTSDGKKVTSKTYYPDDVVSEYNLWGGNLTISEKLAIDKLKRGMQHRIAEPIQTETYIDKNNNGTTEVSELINLQRISYKDWDSDLGLPTNTDLVFPKGVQTLKGEYNPSTNPLDDRIVFHAYYNNGNVKEVSMENGAHIVYVWGYDGKYPIAKIENATFAMSQADHITESQQTLIDNAVSATIDETTNSTENILLTALQSLQLGFPKSMVSTFTYDPLIGVTSMTDPRGNTVYYEYDGYNRLETVRNEDLKLLRDYEYHYKGH